MNDDVDLDARLRAGARAFPPAAPPDGTRLRHVIDTSRRRSRRVQGGVLACGTMAVAGAAGLALRDPGGSGAVEVVAPASTTTAPPPPAVPASAEDLVRGYICGPYALPPVLGEPPHLLYLAPDDAGGRLPGDLQVRIDGVEVFARGEGEPGIHSLVPATVPEGVPPLWTVVVVGSTHSGDPVSGEVAAGDDLLVVLSPLEPPVHELEITAEGVTSVVDLSGHAVPSTEVVTLTTEVPGVLVEWVTVGGACGTEDVDLAPPTTSLDPSSTGAPSTTTPPLPTSPLTVGTSAPPTSGPSVELAPDDGPAAPTTVTSPSAPVGPTTTALSAPPTTVP